MNTIPEIKFIPEKKLVGKKVTVSIANYTVSELWKSFMPFRDKIANRTVSDLISMSVYSADYFSAFSPVREFEKWATVEVKNFDNVPEEFQTFIIPEGKYAVFHYKGLNTDFTIFEYIFRTWLPNSGYELDHRPHFEILGAKYKNNDPDSEEEICIPVRNGIKN